MMKNAQSPPSSTQETQETEVVIIGAGPIGVEMAAVLERQGTRYILLDAGALGESITRWPRDTRFFSSSEWVAVAGIPIQTRDQGIVTGEEYLAYLRQVDGRGDPDPRTSA